MYFLQHIITSLIYFGLFITSMSSYAQKEPLLSEQNPLLRRTLDPQTQPSDFQTQSSPLGCGNETETLEEEVKRLQLEKIKLGLEFDKKMLELQQQKDKLVLENELNAAKQEQLLAQLSRTKTQLELENTINQFEKNHLLAELEATKTRLELENTIREQEKKKRYIELEEERDKLLIQNAILEEQKKRLSLNVQTETEKLDLETKKLEVENSRLATKIAVREQQEQWDNQVNKAPEYLKEPFVNGQLTLSDRKILLDEVILPGVENNMGSAEKVIERLEYFNNKSQEYPIFLIIDYCYGGSTMEGMKIIKAIQSSRAPVYVVVKSLAASMAAVITALASKSFAYPDATIVHHQVVEVIFFAVSNKTGLREQLKILDEWTHRIVEPVAKKMGITLDEFVQKMYQHNSVGDWSEFASEAVKLKWVDELIDHIKDTSFIKLPQEKEEIEKNSDMMTARFKGTSGEQGRSYVRIPHLRPFDAYHLYNPNNYFYYE